MHPKLEHTSTSRSKWRHRQEYNYSRGSSLPHFQLWIAHPDRKSRVY